MYLLIKTTTSNTCLYLYQKRQLLDKLCWSTDKQLADKLLINLKQLLTTNNQDFKQLTGIGVLADSGGFTALRLTHTLANTLSYALTIPAVNASGSSWRSNCFKQLATASVAAGQLTVVTPKYDRPARITTPKK